MQRSDARIGRKKQRIRLGCSARALTVPLGRSEDEEFVFFDGTAERESKRVLVVKRICGDTGEAALCGDGGYTMLALGDLLTQIERKTPVVQIILNNASLDFVKIEQQEGGIIPFGVDFKNPNFAKVAEAMGAKGIRIEAPGDVREGLAEALSYKDGPIVVDTVVDPFALALPSHTPFHAAKGFTLSMAKQVLSGHMDSVIKTMVRNIGLV